MSACPLEDELPEELVAEELPDPQDASKVPANKISSRILIREIIGFFILWSSSKFLNSYYFTSTHRT
jgi:hypothetical protein